MTHFRTAASILSLTFALSFAASNAQAGYVYSADTPSGNHKAGKITKIDTSYNEDNGLFTWSHTIKDKNNGKQSDGFWLVVSDGPNPKTHAGEYAILYGDRDTSTLTAYEYSGQNNGNSWNTPGNYLGSWAMNTTRNAADNRSMFSFAIDTTAVNTNYTGHCSDISNNCDNNSTEWNETMWEGIQFDSQLGYWLHPFLGSDFEYNQNGQITDFSFKKQGWYDKRNLNTTSVSEPATLPILALALMAGFYMRRRQQTV